MADKSAHGSFNDTNIPQTDINVNSDTSTTYSMPLNENNTQDYNSLYEKIDNAIDNVEHRDERSKKNLMKLNGNCFYFLIFSVIKEFPDYINNKFKKIYYFTSIYQ